MHEKSPLCHREGEAKRRTLFPFLPSGDKAVIAMVKQINASFSFVGFTDFEILTRNKIFDTTCP